MNRLDPFIIYTVRLATEGNSREKKSEDYDHFPSTIARIMTMERWSNGELDKPRLKKDDVLSLLYHADAQWMLGTKELAKKEKRLEKAIEGVHQQQRIYLDTLQLVQKTMKCQHRRYQEPIWFTAQVLYHGCQVRHLETFTEHLKPLASNLVCTMEQIRCTMYRIVERKQSELSIFNFLIRGNDTMGEELVPYLERFFKSWSEFEDALSQCYLDNVFGKYRLEFIKDTASIPFRKGPLLHELFQDQFTQLLPLTLERAVDQGILEAQAIASFEPLAFVALPRLAVLAGVTWLAHLTQWRVKGGLILPVWIRSHQTRLLPVIEALDQLELLLTSQSEEAHHTFVRTYRSLEHALVSGNHDLSANEKGIYLDICSIADSVLAGSHAQQFSNVLAHLFNHFGYEDSLENDSIPEQTILDLTI